MDLPSTQKTAHFKTTTKLKQTLQEPLIAPLLPPKTLYAANPATLQDHNEKNLEKPLTPFSNHLEKPLLIAPRILIPEIFKTQQTEDLYQKT